MNTVVQKTYTYPQFDYVQSEEQRTQTLKRHPVVIIGAGPIGLTAALDCAQRGIAVVLIDDNWVTLQRLGSLFLALNVIKLRVAIGFLHNGVHGCTDLIYWFSKAFHISISRSAVQIRGSAYFVASS